MSDPQKPKPQPKGVRAVVKQAAKTVEDKAREMARTVDRLRAHAERLGVA